MRERLNDRPDLTKDDQAQFDELRRSIGRGTLRLPKRVKPVMRVRKGSWKRATWRGVSRWLIVVALVVDIIAWVSYISDQRFFRSLAEELFEGKRPTDQEILTRFVDYAHKELERPSYEDLPSPLIKLYYRYNPFHPSPRDVIEYGCDYRGGCGSSSRVVMALLSAAGIPSRSLILLDDEGRRIHAVVNAFVRGRWAVADPLYGIVFIRGDSTLVTAEELREDRGLFLSNVTPVPEYPADLFVYDNYALLNWKKIPVIMPAARRVLSRTIGEERTASITRPRIWMYPLPAFAVAFTAFTLVFAGIIYFPRALRRSRAARFGEED